jgi:tRNA (guanine37-N1)-methyltransferase
MYFTVLTLFPEMFAPQQESILKRAQKAGLIGIRLVNFRDYALSKHNNVDDVPYGGGAGMVLKPEPIYAAVRALPETAGPRKIIITTPQGRVFNQSLAEEWSKCAELVLICGHYEGFDERIRELADEEVSLGDFVLTGGELVAMVIIDAVSRFVPGVLGGASAYEDSHAHGLLEYPQYTRPLEFEGKRVPDILISGHHANIKRWRRKEALRRTFIRRADLIPKLELEAGDYFLLEELAEENLAIAAWREKWQHLRPLPKKRR